MSRCLFPALALFLSASLGAQDPAPSVKDRLVGTWTLVLVDNILSDGSRDRLYGPHPKGLLIFDRYSRYSLQILRGGRPKFASNDRNKGTAEENRATVQGSNCHFGTYVVDEVARTITFRIEHASFPNWEGTEQKRSFILSGDQLKYTVQAPTSGGVVLGEVVWKRTP